MGCIEITSHDPTNGVLTVQLHHFFFGLLNQKVMTAEMDKNIPQYARLGRVNQV